MTTTLAHLLLALSLGFVSISALAAPNPEATVRQVVDSHFKAVASADRSALEKNWAVAAARITTVDNDKLSSKPIAKAFDLWTSKPSPDMTYTIHSVDLTGDAMATVKATVNWRNGVYQDYLTLMKIDGKWQLTAKHYLTTKAAPVTKAAIGYGAF